MWDAELTRLQADRESALQARDAWRERALKAEADLAVAKAGLPEQPKMDAVREALSLFYSVIQCGEAWTRSCEDALNKANRDMDVHQTAYCFLVRRTEDAEKERDALASSLKLAWAKRDYTAPEIAFGVVDAAIVAYDAARSAVKHG